MDASHWSVLVSYYRRYKWNKTYGAFIFLCTPISVLNLIFLPLINCMAGKNLEYYNLIVCRFYYILLYFRFILALYMVCTTIQTVRMITP